MVVGTLICAVNPVQWGVDTCRAGSKSDYRLLIRAGDVVFGRLASRGITRGAKGLICGSRKQG